MQGINALSTLSTLSGFPFPSPGNCWYSKALFEGLFLEGLIFGGAYLRREICVSKEKFTVFCFALLSHDVTKIQTKKLSILPRFYFHGALEQLKTNFHTNFRFKRVLGFVIEYA